jgi:hypothetical protein
MMGTAKSLGKIDSLFLLNVLAFPCTFRLLLFESLVGFLLARHVRCGGNKEIGNGAHDRKTVFCDCVLDMLLESRFPFGFFKSISLHFFFSQ